MFMGRTIGLGEMDSSFFFFIYIYFLFLESKLKFELGGPLLHYTESDRIGAIRATILFQ